MIEPAKFLKKEIDSRLNAVVNAVSQTVNFDAEILDIGDRNDMFVPKTLRNKFKTKITTLDLENADIVMNLDGNTLPIEMYDRFGSVIACEVIEHMVDTDLFLENIWNALKKDGYLIMTFPNICCWNNRVRVPLGMFPIYGASKVIDIVHKDDKFHVRDFNLRQMTDMLDKHHFEIVNKIGLGMYMYGKLLWRGFPMPVTFSNQILIIAKKRDV